MHHEDSDWDYMTSDPGRGHGAAAMWPRTHPRNLGELPISGTTLTRFDGISDLGSLRLAER